MRMGGKVGERIFEGDDERGDAVDAPVHFRIGDAVLAAIEGCLGVSADRDQGGGWLGIGCSRVRTRLVGAVAGAARRPRDHENQESSSDRCHCPLRSTTHLAAARCINACPCHAHNTGTSPGICATSRGCANNTTSDAPGTSRSSRAIDCGPRSARPFHDRGSAYTSTTRLTPGRRPGVGPTPLALSVA